MPIKGYRVKQDDDSIFTNFGRLDEDYEDEPETPVERLIEDKPKAKVSRRGFLGTIAGAAAGAAAASKVKAGSSFDAVEPLAHNPIKKGKQYIIASTQPDKFTIIRKRELLTPSRCTVQGCSFDIAKRNGFPDGWNTVPQRERRLMVDALQEHVRVAHNRSEDHIIDEEHMPKRWLGAERGLKDL